MQNFKSIETLRAYMAWWVVLGHAIILTGLNIYIPQRLTRVLMAGDIAVDVFIIVSGFVITNMMIAKKEAYLPYIVRRAFRIYPIYLLCLVIGILTTSFYVAAYTGNPWTLNEDLRLARIAAQTENFWPHLGLHLTLLHGMVPENVMPFAGTAFLGPAWSLSLEWQFYLVAPILIGLLSGRPIVLLATSLAALVIHVAFNSGKLGVWLYKPFLPLAIEYFIIGILSRLTLEYRQVSKVPPELLLILVGISAVFVDPRAVLIWSVFFLAVLYEGGRIAPASKPVAFLMNTFIFNDWLARVGTWSYSTYLIHIPLFCVVVGGANMLLGQRSQIEYVVLVAACFPVTLVVSRLLYEHVEKRFNKHGRTVAEWLSRTVSAAIPYR